MVLMPVTWHLTLLAYRAMSKYDPDQSYNHPDTEALATRDRCGALPADIQRRAQAKLMILNNAKDLNETG